MDMRLRQCVAPCSIPHYDGKQTQACDHRGHDHTSHGVGTLETSHMDVCMDGKWIYSISDYGK